MMFGFEKERVGGRGQVIQKEKEGEED